MQGSPLGGKSSLVGGVVVQGLGGFTHREPETPRDTHRYPQTKPAAPALPLQQVGGSSCCIPALWGTGDNGAASLINSGSGC